jgi:hypothetical protein
MTVSHVTWQRLRRKYVFMTGPAIQIGTERVEQSYILFGRHMEVG